MFALGALSASPLLLNVLSYKNKFLGIVKPALEQTESTWIEQSSGMKIITKPVPKKIENM